MLLCIRGLSAEKVAAVIEQYRYPRELWEDYVRLLSEGNVEKSKEGREMLCMLGSGAQKRKIGSALSGQIHELFTEPS